MSCCGKGRSQFQTARTISNSNAGYAPAQDTRVDAPSTSVRFEYAGNTGLTVRGPITGRNYRFNGPGEQNVVDRRDAPSLMAVPKLRVIR
jgi:hypothetical protein